MSFDKEWEKFDSSAEGDSGEVKDVARRFWAAGVQAVYDLPDIKKLTDKEYDSQRYWLKEGILAGAGHIMHCMDGEGESAANLLRHFASQFSPTAGAHSRQPEIDRLREALKDARKALQIPAVLISARPLRPFVGGSEADKLDRAANEVILGCIAGCEAVDKALTQSTEKED